MMPQVIKILNFCRAQGVKFSIEQGNLKVKAAKGALNAEQVGLLKSHKEALISWILSQQKVRAELKAKGHKIAPLSFAQQRLWLTEQVSAQPGLYNIPLSLKLSGQLNIDALNAALNAVIERHQVLRTAIVEQDAQWYQQVLDYQPLAIASLDLASLDDQAKLQSLQSALAEDANKGFALSQGEVIRVMLVRLAEQEHVLAITIHHIAADAWSLGVLTDEFAFYYQQALKGSTRQLPALPVQYSDYALWQRQWLDEQMQRRGLDFWREKLSDMPQVHSLITDRPRPFQPDFNGDCYVQSLSADIAASLQAMAQQQGCTLFMLLYGAFNLVLWRFSHECHQVVGTPINNRDEVQLTELIGFFVNTLVLNHNIDPEQNVSQYFQHIKQGVLASFEHQYIPFDQLVETLEPQCSASHHPLFQIMFSLQQDDISATATHNELPGLLLQPAPEVATAAKFELYLNINESNEGLQLQWEYATALFNRQTIENMAAAMTQLLQQLPKSTDKPLKQISLVDQQTIARLMALGRGEVRHYRAQTCLHQMVEQFAEQQPDRPALQSDHGQMSYAELNTKANRLARLLLESGIYLNQPVGLCLDRDIEAIVGLLAIVKAGATYLPLDPQYPKARLAYMLRDAGAKVVIAQQQTLPKLPNDGLEYLVVDQPLHQKNLAKMAHSNLDLAGLTPQMPAYLMYTSGSTGQPKGVVISHQNVMARIINSDYLEMDSSLTVAQTANFSFDGATFEIWNALLNGAKLRFIESSTLLSVSQLAEQIKSAPINVMFLTTSLFNRIAFERADSFAGLDCLIFGGEAANVEAIRRVCLHGKPKLLLNGYGPTENTSFTTVCQVQDYDQTQYALLNSAPIGKPISNSVAYVLDEQQQWLPQGAVGELYIGGAALSQGYHNQTALNQKVFVEPSILPGPLYRSGDLVRLNNDGELEFVARADSQIKLRGYRINPGEIEAVLDELESIAMCCIMVVENQLCAYLQFQAHCSLTASQLQQYLRDHLPSYMLPSYYLVVERIPLTQNGKLDDKQLIELPYQQLSFGDAVAAESELETVLLSMVAELLGLDSLGVTDSFFDVGGNSLTATKLLGLVRKHFNKDIGYRAFFNAPTIRALAKNIEQGEQSQSFGLTRQNLKVAPLSYAQQRLWLTEQVAQHPGLYNIPLALQLNGELDLQALQYALDGIIERHQVLRSAIIEKDQQLYQQVYPAFSLNVERLDFSGLSGEDQSQAIETALAQAAGRAFALDQAQLVRAGLYRLAANQHILQLTFHHIATDGWSLGVLTKEFSELYRQHKQGQAVCALAALPVQYGDYAAWQRQTLTNDTMAKGLEYWQQQLLGIPQVHALPMDHVRPAMQNFAGKTYCQMLPLSVQGKLEQLARREDVSLFMLLYGVFNILLWRFSGQRQQVVGTPVANRDNTDLEPLIGFFVNTIVLNDEIEPQQQFSAYLQKIKQLVLGAFEHQYVPFDSVVEKVQSGRSSSHHPLFQVMFALQNNEQVECELPDLTLCEGPQTQVACKFDLHLSISQSNEGLLLEWEYATELFDPGTIESMSQSYACLLAQLQCDRPIWQQQVLDAVGSSRVVKFGSGGVVNYPKTESLHQLFAERAREHPETCAVWFNGCELSYGALNAQANQMAAWLTDLGVAQQQVIGLCLPRSFAMVVGVLAILKAGGAYMPLDPTYPKARLKYMLGDAKVSLVLTHSSVKGLLPDNVTRLICLDDEQVATAIEPFSTDNPAVATDAAHSLAYQVYTSGSTGDPKGIEMSHQAAVNQLYVLAHANPALGQKPRMLQYSPLSFDVSFSELFISLLFGGTAVLIEDSLRLEFDAIGETMVAADVTGLFLPHSALLALAQASIDNRIEFNALKVVLSTAEQVQVTPLLRRFFTAHQQAELVNCYGPSETHAVTCSTLTGEPSNWPSLPDIGYVLGNMTAVALSSEQRLQPRGAVGELYVTGDCLAQGYCGNETLTNKAFVHLQDAAAGLSGRFYRTGDLVRFDSQNKLHYLGRADHQVKIRGYRIELGEIEQQLCLFAGVAEAVVKLCGEGENQRLVGYIIADLDTGVDIAQLKSHLQQTLPDYMQLQHIETLTQWPKSPSGKIARNALPEPQWVGQTVGLDDSADETSKKLYGSWCQLLGIEGFALDENFFSLGGHSILAMKLVSEIKTKFGIKPSLKTIFTHAKFNDMVQWLDTQDRQVLSNEPPLVANDDQTQGPQALSFAQKQIWLAQESGAGNSYLLNYHFSVNGHLDSILLNRALKILVKRHDALRTRYYYVGSQFCQQVTALPLAVELLTHVDLTEVDSQNIDAQVDMLLAEQNAEFDLSSGLLLRAKLIDIAANKQVFSLVLHHIAADGWSVSVLAKELSALYHGLSHDTVVDLPPLPLNYIDYSIWQNRRYSASEFVGLQFWQRYLAQMPVMHSLYLDKTRPESGLRHGGFFDLVVDTRLSDVLAAFAGERQTTLFNVLLLAFKLVISRFSLTDDVVVSTTIANRDDARLENVVGCFLNTLLIRTQFDHQQGFAAQLEQFKHNMHEVLANQEVPYELILKTLGLKAKGGIAAGSHLRFVMQNYEAGELSLGDCQLALLDQAVDVTKFDMLLNVTQTSQGLHLGWQYCRDIFDRPVIEAMGQCYQRLLAELVSHPNCALGSLTFCQDQHSKVGRSEPQPAQLSIIDAFEAHVAARGNDLMLHFDDQHLSLAEVDGQANWLADELWQADLDGDSKIAIYGHVGIRQVIALLAIWKLGATAVPLDIKAPVQRLNAQLDACDVEIILVDSKVEPALSSGTIDCPMTDLHFDLSEALADAPMLAQFDGTDDNCDNQTAYIIFTSGSTGVPKGVVVSRDNIAGYVGALLSEYRLDPSMHFAFCSPLSTDIGYTTLMSALYLGAPLYLATRHALLDVEGFSSFIEDNQIDVLKLPPSHLNVLYGEDTTALPRKWLFLGGESLPPQLAKRILSQDAATLVNHYGPCETTVGCLTSIVKNEDLTRSRLALGRPLSNGAVAVVDHKLNALMPGVPGEIVIWGGGVAEGYLDAEHGRDVFVEPSDKGATVVYRSGDLGRVNASGDIEYLGRRDAQVKVRGFRVQITEIESVLLACNDIAQVAVTAQDKGNGVALLAYYVSHNGQTMDSTQLNHYCQKWLPDYMVPEVWLHLNQMPTLSNGKIDRKSLLQMQPTVPEQTRQQSHSAYTEREQFIANLVATLTGSAANIDVPFLQLGGDSLKAIKLVFEAKKMDIQLTLEQLMGNRSLRSCLQDNLLHTGNRGISTEAMTWVTGQTLRQAAANVLPATGLQCLMFAQYRCGEGEFGKYHPQKSFAIHDRDFDVQLFEKALVLAVAKYPAYRTHFELRDASLFQVIADQVKLPLLIEDISNLSATEQRQHIEAHRAQDLLKGFDNTNTPWVRFALLLKSADDFEFIMSNHHCITDGWSNVEFLRCLIDSYLGLKQGHSDDVSNFDISHTQEYLAIEHEVTESVAAQSFWRQNVAAVEDCQLPRLSSPEVPHQVPRLMCYLDGSLCEALNDYAKQQLLTRKSLFLTAMFNVQKTLFGQTFNSIGVISNGRSERMSNPFEATGLYWNLLPVVNRAKTADSDAKSVLTSLLAMEPYIHFPLLEIEAYRDNEPLFFSTFNFIDHHNASVESAHEAYDGFAVTDFVGHDKFHYPLNLAVSIEPAGNEISLRLDFDHHFINQADAQLFMDKLLQQLQAVIQPTPAMEND